MNTERYILPVIIAAGLHGALMLSFMDKGVVPPPLFEDKPIDLTPIIDRIQMTPDESDPGSAGETAGGPEPVPALPEIPTELLKEDIFTVQITERVISLKPITELPKILGEPPGPGVGPGGGFPKVTDLINLDRVPRAVAQPSPEYPAALRQIGINDSVMVEFIVDTTGRVVSAEAVRWTHREFVDPVVRAVLRWRFEPGTVNGRKVSFRVAVPIEFNAER